MFLDTISILASLVLLYFGADFLVRGASNIALRFGVPPLVVGLTLVAYGTSAPELLVSLQSSLAGQGGLAAGNVVGSNSFNICVILGLAALLRPMKTELRVLKIDAPLMVLVSILGVWALSDGMIGRGEAILLLFGAIAYTLANYLFSASHPDDATEVSGLPEAKTASLGLMFLQSVAGVAMLVGGSKLLVVGAVGLAQGWGISDAIIGLTIVAAGTSMPELATSVLAARRGQSEIALGNVIGSNLFNILFILGATGTLKPFAASGLASFDMVFMVGVSVVLWPLIWTGRRLGRAEGFLLLVAYGFYLHEMWPA